MTETQRKVDCGCVHQLQTKKSTGFKHKASDTDIVYDIS